MNLKNLIIIPAIVGLSIFGGCEEHNCKKYSDQIAKTLEQNYEKMENSFTSYHPINPVVEIPEVFNSPYILLYPENIRDGNSSKSNSNTAYFNPTKTDGGPDSTKANPDSTETTNQQGTNPQTNTDSTETDSYNKELSRDDLRKMGITPEDVEKAAEDFAKRLFEETKDSIFTKDTTTKKYISKIILDSLKHTTKTIVYFIPPNYSIEIKFIKPNTFYYNLTTHKPHTEIL